MTAPAPFAMMRDVPEPVSLALMTAADVDDAVRAHISMQHVAYAHLADPGHAAALWNSAPDRRDDLLADLAAATEAAHLHEEPEARHVVARSTRGAIVGLASSFTGVGEWEHDLFGDGHVPAGVDWCLDTLYVMPGLRNAGLGQRLLDAALPDHRDAYLWVSQGNPGARRFYERNGFALDGFGGHSGPNWGDLGMERMVRRSGR